jgi:transcriptional regulator with XRE-family HTH domain
MAELTGEGFSRRLDQILKARGWKQADYAKAGGFATSSFSDWKHEPPSASSRRKLETAAGLPRGALDLDDEPWEAAIKMLYSRFAGHVAPGPSPNTLAALAALRQAEAAIANARELLITDPGRSDQPPR